MSKLVRRRAGPGVIEQLNAALLGKLAVDKLLRACKLRIDTTVVEAAIDYVPTDADLLERAVRTPRRAGAAPQGARRCTSDRVSGPQPLGRTPAAPARPDPAAAQRRRHG